MDLALERQEREMEELEAGVMSPVSAPGLEVKTLAHLERAFQLAEARVVCLVVYTSSCGICSRLLKCFDVITEEYKSQPGKAVFLRHNAVDEFDIVSDCARYYNLKSVPHILFFVDGALLSSQSIHDVRRVMRPRAQVAQEIEALGLCIRSTIATLGVEDD